MRDWKKPADGTFVMWTVIILLVLALLSVISAALAKDFREDRPPPASLQCPKDIIVWVNTKTHVYHFPGMTWYGHTIVGKYLCKRDADLEGDRPTGNGQ